MLWPGCYCEVTFFLVLIHPSDFWRRRRWRNTYPSILGRFIADLFASFSFGYMRILLIDVLDLVHSELSVNSLEFGLKS